MSEFRRLTRELMRPQVVLTAGVLCPEDDRRMLEDHRCMEVVLGRPELVGVDQFHYAPKPCLIPVARPRSESIHPVGLVRIEDGE
jgi:hypothetical protein